jgi:hypothetical protein
VAILLSVTGSISARQVRVGVLTDGPSAREAMSADALEHAAAAVYGDGPTLTVASRSRLNGNWSVSELNAALDRLEADPRLDVVVTLAPRSLSISRSVCGRHRNSLREPAKR